MPMFFNYEKMINKRVITYKIEDGLFSFSVSENNTNHLFQY